MVVIKGSVNLAAFVMQILRKNGQQQETDRARTTPGDQLPLSLSSMTFELLQIFA